MKARFYGLPSWTTPNPNTRSVGNRHLQKNGNNLQRTSTTYGLSETFSHKTEQYIGRAGKPQTEKKVLQIKLEYFEGLQSEIAETIRQVREQFVKLS
jgi:hypothetical protein